jgi:hypothetical protein
MTISTRTCCLMPLLLFAFHVAQGATVNVNCDKGEKIQAALATLDPRGPNTVDVSGTCREYVLIQSFDRLTLLASPSATINGPSTGANDVIDVLDSQRVTIQGFQLNGGNVALFCGRNSTCALVENTIQGTGFAAVGVYESSRLTSSNDLIQNNSFDGVLVQFDSYFETDGGTVIENNLADGVAVLLNSSARIIGAKITGNAGNGVRVDQNSAARIGFVAGSTPNVISGNGGNGVYVGDLSFVRFTPENSITNNTTQPDVACYQQFSATRGALVNIGGGTTNCSETAPAKSGKLLHLGDVDRMR